MMTRPSRDPSIEHEPHLQGPRAQDAGQSDDPSEQRAEEILRHEAARAAADDAVEHTVWDEPALAPELAGIAADDQITYASWLKRKLGETSSTKTWLVTMLIVLGAGPLGIFGALFSGIDGSAFNLAMIIIIGPVTEEITKIAAALWVVEKRPFLFQSIWQIFICAVAGGVAFAYIENLIYLNVYIPDHSADLANWRWTICVGLHMNCSFIAGVGLARIWDNAIRNLHRPQLALGVPWFVMAMVGHGLYNGIVLVAERAGWIKF